MARPSVGKDLLCRGVDEETKSDLNIPFDFLTRALENGVRVVVVVVGSFSVFLLICSWQLTALWMNIELKLAQ